jgi:enoyl-CoA hydratase/carnithine racemase
VETQVNAVTEKCDLDIIAASGAKCSGGDDQKQRLRLGMNNEIWLTRHVFFERYYWALIAGPVIAAVNGHAFGAASSVTPIGNRRV